MGGGKKEYNFSNPMVWTKSNICQKEKDLRGDDRRRKRGPTEAARRRKRFVPSMVGENYTILSKEV